jgi:hypothetical protein
MKMYEEVQISIHVFLTSALDGGERQPHALVSSARRNISWCLGFEVFTVVIMNQREQVVPHSRFFSHEDGGDTFLGNVGSHKIYTAPHPRRRYSSFPDIRWV